MQIPQLRKNGIKKGRYLNKYSPSLVCHILPDIYFHLACALACSIQYKLVAGNISIDSF